MAQNVCKGARQPSVVADSPGRSLEVCESECRHESQTCCHRCGRIFYGFRHHGCSWRYLLHKGSVYMIDITRAMEYQVKLTNSFKNPKM